MRRWLRLFASFLVPAVMLAGVAVNPAVAQDAMKAEKGHATIKVLAENDRLRAYEISYKPGDVNSSVPASSVRVVRILRGGTLLRTHADGKTEKVEVKAGDVRINMPTDAYTSKNVGKTELVIYIVLLK